MCHVHGIGIVQVAAHRLRYGNFESLAVLLKILHSLIEIIMAYILSVFEYVTEHSATVITLLIWNRCTAFVCVQAFSIVVGTVGKLPSLIC